MPAKIYLTKEQEDTLKHDYYVGVSLRELSRKMSMSIPTINAILGSLGLERMGRIAEKDIEVVIQHSGYNLTKISEISGLDRTTVKKILSSRGLTYGVKRATKPEPVKNKTRYEIFVETYTVEDITALISRSVHYACTVTGFSDVIIKRFANEHNISYKKAFTTIKHVSDTDKERMISLYIENVHTVVEIREMFGIGAKTLRKIVREYNRPLVPRDEDFEKYKQIVRRLTSVVKNLFDITPSAGYHVDHRLSVYDGYTQQVPPYLVASFENLEIITAEENLKKGSSSSITKDELYRLHGLI